MDLLSLVEKWGVVGVLGIIVIFVGSLLRYVGGRAANSYDKLSETLEKSYAGLSTTIEKSNDRLSLALENLNTTLEKQGIEAVERHGELRLSVEQFKSGVLQEIMRTRHAQRSDLMTLQANLEVLIEAEMRLIHSALQLLVGKHIQQFEVARDQRLSERGEFAEMTPPDVDALPPKKKGS